SRRDMVNRYSSVRDPHGAEADTRSSLRIPTIRGRSGSRSTTHTASGSSPRLALRLVPGTNRNAHVAAPSGRHDPRDASRRLVLEGGVEHLLGDRPGETAAGLLGDRSV